MALALLTLHGVVAMAAPLLVRRLGRRALLICGLAPAAATVWVATQFGDVVLGQRPVTQTVEWVPALGLEASFRLDAFALLMVLLVSGIGTLVFAFAAAYFPAGKRDLGGFAGSLTAFAGSMLGLVLADNLILLFVFWEATSITSYLLIGTNDRDPAARGAALQAMLTTGAGGLALLGGIVLLAQSAGTYSLSALLADPPAGGVVPAGIVLVLVGAFTKSAQVPFHAWLPGAMAAPTPVSAYLHSATMVKAGVYVVARFAPAFAVVPVWRPLVLTVGAATMILGAYRALRQHDLKLLLAYGTVSQLGFLIVLFGIGTPDATFAATALILAHGLFKAALFLVTGQIDVRTGTRDIRRLQGLRTAMPVPFAVAVIAAGSMAGLPPLLGFIAKEAALEGLLHGGFGGLQTATILAIVAGSALTMAYSLRFVIGAFGGSDHGALAGASPAGAAPRRATAGLGIPAAILATLTLVTGLVPALADSLVNAASAALDPRVQPHRLALWHGVNTALVLSAVVIGAGTALFAVRGRVERWQTRMPPLPSAKGAYDRVVRAVVITASRTTGVVQNGSLPTYLVVILLTVVALPGTLLIPGAPPLVRPALAANWMQLAICVVTVVAAVAVAMVGRRFAAVLLLGAVGYSVAALFVLHGAPDLALTQMLVETLSLVIFVLVLRHLPSRFGRRPGRADRVLRASVAAAVGVGVFAFALVAAAARPDIPSVSAEYIARSLPEAEGRNIVNVILVDFRALDTLGEITVLVTAAIGIASLVLAGRITRRAGAFEGDRDAPPVDGGP